MRYETISDLPDAVRDVLPEGAQELYLEAYKQSWEEFDEEAEPGDMDRHSAAHRDAWSAVKSEYVHDEDKGMWYREGKQPEKGQDLLDSLKDLV